ncbi:MAG TPA: alpha-N-acetylglucosaminidase [Bacteroidales bacterium]|nr:alpha-N-acetylglucosaminidase [Bacteroidales bacterium]
MKIVCKKIALLGMMLLIYFFGGCDRISNQEISDDDVLRNVYQLAERVLDERSGNFIFELSDEDDGHDFFEVSGEEKKIIIRGNNGVSLASGLNWYLKNYCDVQFSIIDEQMNLPTELPVPEKAVRKTTRHRYRYFFNVCTFGYTMAWWNWDKWERHIDWMAMNGINLPLAITGQEAVWYEVYKELGFSEKQIKDFIVGPAYFPWGWMGNVDGLGGPLPDSWINKHKTLQQKILQRERAFGMTPVLQGFTGHVPETITELYPESEVHKTSNWSAGFGGTYFLDPGDDLFKRIGKLYIEKQTEMFGTNHYYSADCFNEINPDTDDPEFLADMSRTVFNSFTAADPEAVWVMQAWFLYYSIGDFWKDPQSRALIEAVPDERMIMLDLYGELHPTWKKKSAFYGKPWIWNVLHNFGGRTSMSGKLGDIASNLGEALKSDDKGNLSGIGMAMEYFGNNPVVQEYVMDMVWSDEIPDPEQWLLEYTKNRYGKHNEFANKAWQSMLETVYNTHKQTGTFVCERPGFYNPDMAYRTSPVPDYDQEVLCNALKYLLKCSGEFKDLDTYQFDLVNLTRQVISPLAYYWVLDLEEAFKQKDIDRFLELKKRIIELIKDFDILLSTRSEYLLGTWLEDAKKWAETEEEEKLYEWNARNLITMWGEKCTENQYDDLNNYAYKQWAGMFSDYHLARWNSFFKMTEDALRNNSEFERAPFLEASCEWEKEWSHKRDIFPAVTKGDPVEVSQMIWKKYSGYFLN